MDYMNIKLNDALTMAHRHGCSLIDDSYFDDDLIPVWASNNYHGCIGAPGDMDELCGHACICVGVFKQGIISQEVYLRAMRNIDQRLSQHYGTSLEIELLC